MKMFKFALVSLLLTATGAHAAQFESIIDAMALKSPAVQSGSSWSDVSKMKGIKWKWPYYESGSHNATMVGRTKVGTAKNPNIGVTDITVSGTRTMLRSVSIVISNEGATLTAFGKGKATKVRTSCDSQDLSNTVEFYLFEKPGYQPLYISYQSESGATGVGSVAFEVAYVLEDVLSFYGDCKALK